MGRLVKRTGLSCTFLQRPPVTLRWAQTSSKQNTVNVSGQWFVIAAVTKAYLVQQQSMLYSATTCTHMLYIHIQYLWFSLVITSRTTLYLAPLKSRHFPRLLQGAAAIWLANTHGTLAKCLSVRNLLTGLSKASTWLQHCSLMVAVRLPCLPVFLEWFKAIAEVLGYHRTWIDMIILLCLTGTEWATCCYFANKALLYFAEVLACHVILCASAQWPLFDVESMLMFDMLGLWMHCLRQDFCWPMILTFPAHLSVCSEGAARCIGRIGKWIEAWGGPCWEVQVPMTLAV